MPFLLGKYRLYDVIRRYQHGGTVKPGLPLASRNTVKFSEQFADVFGIARIGSGITG
jgi:hypothetical protein